MKVNGLDHINIRTQDLTASAQFYIDVFGLHAEPTPTLPPERALWLCDHNDKPIIHLFIGEEMRQGTTGPIHHVALDCSGMAEMCARLRARKLDLDIRDNPDQTFAQVFVPDPFGILWELIFHDEGKA
jgi:catechol 2,3-dioxygenase-like lactoylglutathione lyase family enzyme